MVPLNNNGLERNLLEFRRFQGDIPGSGSKITAVVTAVVPLPLLIALIPHRLGQFLRLGLQQFVERFLYAAAHKFLELSLDYFLV